MCNQPVPMNEDAAVPDNVELAREWLSEQDSPRRAKGDPQDSHALVFQVAVQLVWGFDLGKQLGGQLLTEYCGRSDKPWTPAEIEHKIREAECAPKKHKQGGLARWMLRKKGLLRVEYRGGSKGGQMVASEPRFEAPRRLKFDLAKLRHEVRDVPLACDESWLAEVSPVKVETCTVPVFLEALYKPGERILIFTDFYSQGQFIYWCGRGSFCLSRRPGVKAVPSALPNTAREGIWFLCQPVSGEWLPNPRSLDKQGRPKLSRRSEEEVTAWRYLVLESDDAPAELWIRLLCKLPLPIAAIYTSGGRSVHALVRVECRTKEEWDKYKTLLVPIMSLLGADPGALSAVRLTRLPFCFRQGARDDNERYYRYDRPRLQRLLYLNPNPGPVGEPILWREGALQ